jgi:transcriptional regulator with XRE-family HTH domain
MESLVNETRNLLGLSAEELAELMGIEASSAADLERDEKAGTASTRSILEALEVMVQTAATVAIAPKAVEAAERAARRVAQAVKTTMDLEGQSVAADVAEELYERALFNELVKLICASPVTHLGSVRGSAQPRRYQAP